MCTGERKSKLGALIFPPKNESVGRDQLINSPELCVALGHLPHGWILQCLVDSLACELFLFLLSSQKELTRLICSC